MWLMLAYTALAIIGNALIYLVGLGIEKIWPAASLPLYLLMFFVVLWIAWIAAVKITAPRSAT